ncbi:MAG: hypothetical protein WC343_11030 [Bacilli bacterium]
MDRTVPTPRREALAQALSTVRSEMEYDRWMYENPYLRFPASWAVQVIPPFGGAVARFCVRNRSGRVVSVFLDCYGAVSGEQRPPYWEISPSADGEPERFGMEDVAGLMAGLRRSLRKRGPGAGE